MVDKFDNFLEFFFKLLILGSIVICEIQINNLENRISVIERNIQK